MVEGDEEDCLMEYSTDVDGGIEVIDKVWVVWMVVCDEEDCLLEYITDVDSGSVVVNEVWIVSVVEGNEVVCLAEYINDVEVWVVLVVEGDEEDCLEEYISDVDCDFEVEDVVLVVSVSKWAFELTPLYSKSNKTLLDAKWNLIWLSSTVSRS